MRSLIKIKSKANHLCCSLNLLSYSSLDKYLSNIFLISDFIESIMSASHTRRSRRGQPSTTLEGGDQTPVSVPPNVSTQSIQGVPTQISNDQMSDEEFYNSPSNSDEPDLNDFGSSAEDEIDPSDPRRMFNPHEPYDKKLGLSPAFIHCVLTIGLTGHMVRSLVGLSITEPDTLFVMKEEELMSKCAFEFVHIMGFRIAQHEWKESRRPIPSGVLGTLPRFRGTHQLSIQEPFAFLTQFESVLTACSTPKRVWPKFLTLCLTKPEDVSFWKYPLEIHPGLLWSDYAQAFLQHFERYNQQLKWMEQITTLKQDAKEKICSYLDRSADIARRAGRSLDDETFLYYLRKCCKLWVDLETASRNRLDRQTLSIAKKIHRSEEHTSELQSQFHLI